MTFRTWSSSVAERQSQTFPPVGSSLIIFIFEAGGDVSSGFFVMEAVDGKVVMVVLEDDGGGVSSVFFIVEAVDSLVVMVVLLEV